MAEAAEGASHAQGFAAGVGPDDASRPLHSCVVRFDLLPSDRDQPDDTFELQVVRRFNNKKYLLLLTADSFQLFRSRGSEFSRGATSDASAGGSRSGSASALASTAASALPAFVAKSIGSVAHGTTKLATAAKDAGLAGASRLAGHLGSGHSQSGGTAGPADAAMAGAAPDEQGAAEEDASGEDLEAGALATFGVALSQASMHAHLQAQCNGDAACEPELWSLLANHLCKPPMQTTKAPDPSVSAHRNQNVRMLWRRSCCEPASWHTVVARRHAATCYVSSRLDGWRAPLTPARVDTPLCAGAGGEAGWGHSDGDLPQAKAVGQVHAQSRQAFVRGRRHVCKRMQLGLMPVPPEVGDQLDLQGAMREV